MPGFSKLFPFLQRFHFPPFGEALNPREVSPDVQLVHELFRADFKHALRMKTVQLSTAGAGAFVNHIAIEEPPPGFVSIPLIIACALITLGPLDLLVETRVTTNPPDIPTGVWPALGWMQMDITVLNRLVAIPCRFPIPRGNELNIAWNTVLAGRTVITRSCAVEMPIECVDWQAFGVDNFVRTQGL